MRVKTTALNYVSAMLLATVSHAALATTTNYSQSVQDVLNGDSAVAASANYGAGIVFGDIDTGIAPSVWFTPAYNGAGVSNIDTVNSAVCLNGTCKSVNPVTTPTDGNSHGTFTASQLVGGVPGSGLEGMDPAGKVLSVQVLSASGSGTSTDVANGITYAVNHGAEVLNLSLGPTGTAAQDAAFYQSIASAVNYAASKGVYIVFAGGNSATTLTGTVNMTGFTSAAIQHMLFMGSTGSTEKLSSFSNTPGTASFVSTTGQKTAYDSMWLMADGENIIGASNYYTKQYGYGYIQTDSGTSMAAPQGTGALGLLLAKWPVLIKNGDAALVLESTGTDLGTKGVDTTYGEGFLNLSAAFQPVGALSVTTVSGASVPVTSLTSSMVTSGALGSLSSVTSQLANYTAFDTFQRNFSVNLSGLIVTKPTTSAPATPVTRTSITTNTTKRFADGSSLDFTSSQADPLMSVSNPSNPSTSWAVNFTDASGATLAAGQGYPSTASFADALWGSGSLASAGSNTLGASSSLMSLAEGGAFAAYGMPLDNNHTRVALSWTETQNADPIAGAGQTDPSASGFSAGLTQDLTDSWKAGVTFGMIDQENGLLGTTYANNGLVNFGSNHQSFSVGASSAFNLSDTASLMFDAAIARTSGANLSGIISSVTPLYARSFGAALVDRDAVDRGDSLSLSLRAPLKVTSGSATLAMTSVDENGNASTASQRVALRPNGTEYDLAAGYQSPVVENFQWNMTLEARHDADNIAGVSDVAGIVGAQFTF